LFDLAREINRRRDDGDVGAAQGVLREIAGILGLTLEEPVAPPSNDIAPFVRLLVDLRSELREAKQFALADKVRNELAVLGISLEDGSEGTVWRLHSD
jgi:cysteinyl-tRNA synthetase